MHVFRLDGLEKTAWVQPGPGWLLVGNRVVDILALVNPERSTRKLGLASLWVVGHRCKDTTGQEMRLGILAISACWQPLFLSNY